MAKILKSADAPSDAVHFSFGAVEFDLNTPKASFKTDDATVISGALSNPWLDVEFDAATVDPAVASRDPLDPHNDPRVDHLSALGSAGAVAAADSNEAAIREAVGAADPTATAGASSPDNPTISETVQSTFDTVNSDAKPELPPTQSAIEATEPGGGVAPGTAGATSSVVTTPEPPATDDTKKGS